MGIAIVETAGLLFPVALMPWTSGSSRAWATLYVLGAAVLAAATYYFPFDVVIMNGEVIGPKHAPYGLGLLLSLPFGAIGYLVGWLNGDAARGPMRHLPRNRRHPAEAATADGGGCCACQEARWSRSKRCSHSVTWFQLAMFWSTTLRSPCHRA
jgi:hypothetical protein